MATHNARQTDRAPFFAEIDVLAADTTAPRRLWGGDVSEAGMFVQTTHPYRVGDKVALRFDLDDAEVHVRAAEVMWVRPFEPISVDGKMPGIGLRFVMLDPPARAALRRLVRQAAGEHRPGDTTLPDAASQAIPHDGAASVTSLPATHSMLARAGAADAERTEELRAVTVPPFTDPPRSDRRQASIDAVLAPPLFPAPAMSFTLPPDEPALDAEVRVFQTPAAVTMGPKRTSKATSTPPAGDAPEPFVGWTFRKAPDDEPAPPESAPPEALALSFDDERPGSLLEPAVDDDQGPSELHVPEASVHDRGDAPGERFTLRDGEGALSGKPVAAERRRAPTRRPLRVLPLAAALLTSGALIGVGVGVVSKRIERAPVEASQAALAQPAEQPGEQQAAAASVAPSAPEPAAHAATVQSVAAVERTLTPVDVVAGAVATAAPRERRMPAATRAAGPATSRVEVAVGRARVLKTFTLTGPNRVVVDLADATLPGKAAPTQQPGVTRVRFGAPAPGTSRVVIETEQAARQPTARVIGGRLIVSFAS
ncbi:MAG: AMIN domain-containing protein [Deltaproteobacteria bacterium]|nr:AMIN domain-containing protein [Deltaproteobacteria bacterium]